MTDRCPLKKNQKWHLHRHDRKVDFLNHAQAMLRLRWPRNQKVKNLKLAPDVVVKLLRQLDYQATGLRLILPDYVLIVYEQNHVQAMDELVFYPGASGRDGKKLFGHNPVQRHCEKALLRFVVFDQHVGKKEVVASS